MWNSGATARLTWHIGTTNKWTDTFFWDDVTQFLKHGWQLILNIYIYITATYVNVSVGFIIKKKDRQRWFCRVTAYWKWTLCWSHHIFLSNLINLETSFLVSWVDYVCFIWGPPLGIHTLWTWSYHIVHTVGITEGS